MSEPKSTNGCVACAMLRRGLCEPECGKHPDRKECLKPRRPHEGLVCGPCRSQVTGDLRDIPNLHQVAAHLARTRARRPNLVTPAEVNLSRGMHARAGMGSFESTLPGGEDVLNLVGPGSLDVTTQGLENPRDQHGVIPPLVLLHSWVRDWCEVRDQAETGPRHVGLRAVVEWLSARLDWAFTEHPAVDEFCRDVHELAAHMRSVAGLHSRPDELPAPCPTCNAVNDREKGTKGLQRENGADFVECKGCGRLWTEPEYQRLTVVLAAEQELLAKREGNAA